MRSPHRPAVGRAVVVAAVLAVLGLTMAAPSGRAAVYPPAPLPFDRELLSNLTAPSVGPGASSTLSFRLFDPAGFFPLSHVVVGFEVYALNGYPGDAVGPVPVSNAPVLENLTASGPSVNVTLASLSPNAVHDGSVTVVTSEATPAGTYAVRTELSFVANSTDYLFESRGWFSESAWQNATQGANGSATINLSRLGVSGIVPETAVYVAPSGWPVAVGALVAVGLVLLALGAWVYFRRGPKSRSGAGNDEPPGATNAPRAFGRSRSRPGDSRSS
ncbi:MAG TPA: hypothetical protein VEH10_03305 [Thermoplasmata archaeon]|nr:hypothetical protein [Thermoplasmata archaeon]